MDNKGKILIIEDNRNVLDTIVDILEYAGYAPTGLTRFNEDTLEMMEDERFSLIILDVMLSGADGRDLAKRFKSRPETKGVPIVMISAYPSIESSVKEAGADEFIQKPFGLKELIQKVEQVT